MDIRMPVMDGIEATRRVTSVGGSPRLLVLTTFDLDDYGLRRAPCRSQRLLLKDVTAEQLFDAVRVVAAGNALLAPSITRRLIETFVHTPRNNPPGAGRLATLTARDRRAAPDGPRDVELGTDHLVLGAETVKTHVSRVRRKLAARDRTQAVIAAYECGLIVPGG